jgi:hypothetical protein
MEVLGLPAMDRTSVDECRGSDLLLEVLPEELIFVGLGDDERVGEHVDELNGDWLGVGLHFHWLNGWWRGRLNVRYLCGWL